MDIDRKEISEVYSRLGDDLSRRIFTDTLLCILTEDKRFVKDMASTLSEGKEFYQRIKDAEYIYGCGYYGEWLADNCDNKWKAFIDSDTAKQGQTVKGIPVISLNDVKTDSVICVANRYSHREIYRNLLDKGFSQNRIIDLGEYLEEMEKKQYFDLAELPKNKISTFVDVGALDGKTTLNFIEWVQEDYKKVLCLEPDEINIKNCKVSVGNNEKIEILPFGAWSEDTTLSFISSGEMSSRISEAGDNVVEVKKIDHFLKNHYETRELYIKMDIEGAEAEALEGATETIRKCGPTLAICTYHNEDDIWKLPKMIMSLRDDYTFYFRHYHLGKQETVMYAV